MPFRVLLIDDSIDDRLLAREAFEEAKLLLEIDEANDGAAGLIAMRLTPPDLILLDINMPRVNGHEVLAAMRADPALRAIPVVIMSTSNADADILKSYTRGASAYCAKPIDFDKFRDIVAAIGGFYFTVVRLPARAP